MDCKDFKNIIVCLFDKDVDGAIKAECENHMAECQECREYYEELKEAFDMLVPKEEVSSHKGGAFASNLQSGDENGENIKTKVISMPRIYKMRKYAAAVAIFVIGVVVGWTHLFSPDAVAKSSAPVAVFSQAIGCVQNVGSFQMDIYVRTLPAENFQYIDEKADFVRVNVKLMRQDGQTLYRVEKEGGRTVVCDGESQYMWDDKRFLKGGKETNFLERFGNIIYPEKFLAMQDSSICLSDKNKVERTETDSTVTVVTESYEKNMDLQQLFDKGKMADSRIIMENVFSKNDGLLRDMKMYIENGAGKHLIMYCNDIQYNTMMNRSALVALPEVDGWQMADIDISISKTRSAMLQKENAQQAAQRIINSIISGDERLASEALYYYKDSYADLYKKFKDCTASDFVVREEKNYAGVYVFYTLATADGKCEKKHIAIRRDNEQRVWIVDGGL